MNTFKLTTLMVFVGVAALPSSSRAAVGDVPISDGASADESMRQYRQPQDERGAWRNPYLMQAPESGDQMMASIVVEYRDRAELDRGGWENPYLPPAAAGNPLLAVAPGSGLTAGSGPSEGSLASAKDDGRMEEGAGSGEPQPAEQPKNDAQPRK